MRVYKFIFGIDKNFDNQSNGERDLPVWACSINLYYHDTLYLYASHRETDEGIWIYKSFDALLDHPYLDKKKFFVTFQLNQT